MQSTALLLAALPIAPIPVLAMPIPAPAIQPAPQRPLRFAAHTGAGHLGDQRHSPAQGTKPCLHPSDVAGISYDRSVSLFHPNNQRAAGSRTRHAKARAARVRGMRGFTTDGAGITVEEASTVDEVEQAAMGELARLVVDGRTFLSK